MVVVVGGELRDTGCVTAVDPLLKRELFPHFNLRRATQIVGITQETGEQAMMFYFSPLCAVSWGFLEKNSCSFMLAKGLPKLEAPSRCTLDLYTEGISPMRIRQPADSSREAFAI